jgi:hypothetical protein
MYIDMGNSPGYSQVNNAPVAITAPVEEKEAVIHLITQERYDRMFPSPWCSWHRQVNIYQVGGDRAKIIRSCDRCFDHACRLLDQVPSKSIALDAFDYIVAGAFKCECIELTRDAHHMGYS